MAVGFAWLFAGYLAIGHIFPKPSSATGVAADAYAVARFVTPAGVALALGVLAYLIGIVAFQRFRVPFALPRLGRVDAALTESAVARLADRIAQEAEVRARVVRHTVAIGRSAGTVVDAELLDDLLRKDASLREAAVRSTLDTTAAVARLRAQLPSLAAGEEYERLCAERDYRAGMAAPLFAIILTLAVRGSGWWLLAVAVPALLVRAAVQAHTGAVLTLVPLLPSAQEEVVLREGGADSAWAWPAVRVVRALAVSPDATVVAGGTIDGRVHLWSTDSGDLIRSLDAHREEVTSLAFSPDGELLVSGGEDRCAKVWEVPTGVERQRLELDEPVMNVAVNRDGVFVIGTRASLSWWYRDGQGPSKAVLDSPWLDHMALDPDSKLLAVALDDGTLRVYVGEIPVDLATYEDLALAGWSGLNPFVVGFTKAAEQTELRTWDPLTGKQIHPATVIGGALRRPTVARPQGNWLAVAAEQDQVLLLDVQSGEIAKTLTGHRDEVTALAWSSNGDLLASSADDGTVIVWDVAEGRSRLRLVPPSATL